jgi:hypothetical protein
MSVKGKRHMGRVAAIGCILCQALGQGKTPAEVHHLREGQGGGQRADDFLTIPLCPSCHRGSQGIHGDKTLLRITKLTELDLLAMTLEALA